MPLVGCTTQYKCGELKTVQPGHTLSPWVRVVFRDGGGNMITVGNKSSPSLDNSAVIKSFNYGFSSGAECKITIHDTMGSSLSAFLKNMMKEFKDSSERIVEFEWGWTNAGCPTEPPPGQKSDKHYLTLAALETNYIQGKFIHEISALDVTNTSVQGGIEKIYGEDGKNSLYLKDALEKLLKEKPDPIVKEIKYCRMENGKMVCNAGFKENNGKGPKHCWRGNAANKLETAKKWISGWVTDKDKIFEMQYDATVDGGSIIFMEKPTKECNEGPDESLCIGTYIVNGGNDTPVIEFNPRIKWDFGPVGANGGNMATNTIEDQNTPNNKSQGIKKCPNLSRNGNKGAGQVISTPPTDVHKDIKGKEATSTNNDANSKQLLQDGIHIMDNGIMADMVIVGDPRFPMQYEGVIDGKTVAIAFVNPFHIMPSGGACGDWLAKPPCNAILSQKDWFIQKVNHRIEGGTYTTSLALRLTSDGLDAPIGAHIK